MKKLFVTIIIIYSSSSFGWSFTDKLLYDSYKSCLNNKLKDIDKTKTNMAAARSVFNEECSKAFCVAKREVTQDEYNSCRERQNYICEQGGYGDCSLKYIDKYCKEQKYQDSSCGPEKV